MTFDTRKVLAGQQIATIVDLELDRCRHTTAQSVLDGTITASAGVTDVFTGALAITGGTATSFINSNPFIFWDDEIIKVDVDSDIQLTITARAQLGTVAVAHSAGAVTLTHSGEADGTCYGTPFTCTSPDSYEANTKLLFRFPSTQLDLSEIFYNGFKSWTHNPVVVDPGQTMGKRASVSVTLLDSVDNDVYVPYPDRRTSNGTLFTKLLARHPNFEGRPLKVHTGFDPLDLDFANFITREYIIDNVQISKGVFSVKGMDPLIMTDDKKSKAPMASLGTNTIAITGGSTTITYTGAPAFDYGVATSTAFVRLDTEVIETTVLSDFVLTIVTRGVGGTDIKDHAVNASVQECLVYTLVNVVTIIEDLLINFTTIPSTFLDDYTDVIAATSSITLTANINKPTEVKTLINELIKVGDLTMFYDEENQKIRIKQVADASVEPININEDDHIGQDSITFTRDTKGQFTRYSVAWAPNDITKTKDDENFSIVFQSINLNNELPENIGEINEKRTEFIRWLTTSSGDVIKGTSIAQRTIDRVENVPEIAEFDLDVENVFDTQGGVLEPGAIVNISSSRTVEVDGTAKASNYQVLTQKDLGNMRYRVKAKLFQDPLEGITVDFTISVDKQDYDLATEFTPAAGNYIVLIDTGVTIGATSTANPAFTTGAQAAGVSFDFIFRGALEGAAGDGGNAGALVMPAKADVPGNFSDDGDDGIVGGNAFNATVDCTISTGSGAIWAGGGGAGGGRSFGSNDPVTTGTARNGGSGGQGFVGGLGGDAGIVEIEPGPTTVDTGQAGVDGSRGAPGSIGGVSGGQWGQGGDDGVGVAIGGLPGFAIVSNSNNVTITSGNNPLNIRGRIS